MASSGDLPFLRSPARREVGRALIVLALVFPGPARAHLLGTSSATVEASGNDVSVSLAFHPADLQDLDAARAAGLLAVTVERGACVAGTPAVALESAAVRVSTSYRCPGPADAGLSVVFGYLHRLPASHRTLGLVRAGGRQLEFTASAANPAVALQGPPGVLGFLVMGVEHILGGADHLLFLAGLLLGVRKTQSMVKVVSAFTVAHSITLALAATGVLRIPSSVVEPAIAASIVYVAAENVLLPGKGNKTAVALAFGLIHGCGFASVLSEAGLTGTALFPALVGFNCGVEVGQMVVVALALPVLFWLQRRTSWERLMLPSGSAVLGFAGTYWFVARLLG